jgi:hypothetical protein
MYMRKQPKRTVQLGGAAPDGKIPFPLMIVGTRTDPGFNASTTHQQNPYLYLE